MCIRDSLIIEVQTWAIRRSIIFGCNDGGWWFHRRVTCRGCCGTHHLWGFIGLFLLTSVHENVLLTRVSVEIHKKLNHNEKENILIFLYQILSKANCQIVFKRQKRVFEIIIHIINYFIKKKKKIKIKELKLIKTEKEVKNHQSVVMNLFIKSSLLRTTWSCCESKRV